MNARARPSRSSWTRSAGWGSPVVRITIAWSASVVVLFESAGPGGPSASVASAESRGAKGTGTATAPPRSRRKTTASSAQSGCPWCESARNSELDHFFPEGLDWQRATLSRVESIEQASSVERAHWFELHVRGRVRAGVLSKAAHDWLRRAGLKLHLSAAEIQSIQRIGNRAAIQPSQALNNG